MLRIRFSRTGKVGQPSYRIILAERSAPVKSRYIELLGNYLPAVKPKIVALKKDRILYWISKGAIPTDSTATLFKREGMEGMDKYIAPRTKKRAPKGEEKEEATPAKATASSSSAPADKAPVSVAA